MPHFLQMPWPDSEQPARALFSKIQVTAFYIYPTKLLESPYHSNLYSSGVNQPTFIPSNSWQMRITAFYSHLIMKWMHVATDTLVGTSKRVCFL